MATEAQYQQIAKDCEALADKMKAANSLSRQLTSNNSANEADWNSQEAQDALDALGTDYTAADVSNVLGSLSTFQTSHWDAGNGGNYEQLARPIV